MVQTNYLFILALLFAGVAFALAPLAVVWLVAPRKRSMAKYDTYECGVKTYGETWVRFRIQYYIYGILFVLFDVETVFLYPWAVAFDSLGIFGLLEMTTFIILLLFGYIYAWRKGGLEWV